MKASSLHPSLQRLAAVHRRRLRMFGLLFFMFMAAALIFMMTMALTHRDMTNLLIFAIGGLVMLPVMALMGGLLWYLERWQARRLNAADQLLQADAPVIARLTPTGLANRTGVLVAMYPETQNGSAAAEPLFAVLDPTARLGRTPQQESTARLYCAKQEPGEALVVLQEHDNAVLGKLVTWERYHRQMTWTKALALSVILLGVTALVVSVTRDFWKYLDLEQAQQAATASEKWPSTMGTVRNRELMSVEMLQKNTVVTAYEARVEFEYPVAGTTHHGDLLAFCQPPSLIRTPVEARLARYSVNASVEVHYDPADPARAVLEPGHAEDCTPILDMAWRELLLSFGLGFIGLLVSLGVVVIWELRRRRQMLQGWVRPGS
ncbi:MAG: DUF3592 domain-containing protein [Phycisphaerales bacterium]|nr:DUF3592 domain-containing protein [Phycisphaerales bacterium]